MLVNTKMLRYSDSTGYIYKNDVTAPLKGVNSYNRLKIFFCNYLNPWFLKSSDVKIVLDTVSSEFLHVNHLIQNLNLVLPIMGEKWHYIPPDR